MNEQFFVICKNKMLTFVHLFHIYLMNYYIRKKCTKVSISLMQHAINCSTIAFLNKITYLHSLHLQPFLSFWKTLLRLSKTCWNTLFVKSTLLSLFRSILWFLETIFRQFSIFHFSKFPSELNPQHLQNQLLKLYFLFGDQLKKHF